MSNIKPMSPSCQQIINSLPEPFVVIDDNYVIRAANHLYSERYGEKGVDVIGRNCFQVLHNLSQPCSQKGQHCPFDPVFHSAERIQVIHENFSEEGVGRLRISAMPILDEGNNIQFLGESISPVIEQVSSPLLIGRSRPLRHMISMLQRVASTPTTVLLLGESGVGKECAAQYVHQYSDRVDEEFIVVDCSTLGEQLIESELFGHEKGAFTGAIGHKRGLIEAADGGTLFVDEIGELPMELQTKLLRFLEAGTFRRVGGTQYRKANVRVVAATHRDLQSMVTEGKFREDLYYRISAFPVVIPPLRERKGDIVLLAENFLKKMENGEQQIPLSPDVIEMLLAYDYPGNVRELRNIMERALILCAFEVLTPEHLVFDGFSVVNKNNEILDSSLVVDSQLSVRSVDFLSRRRKVRPTNDEILSALSKTDGKRKQAAKLLGIGERSMYRYIKEMI